jgi:hypothetical protein
MKKFLFLVAIVSLFAGCGAPEVQPDMPVVDDSPEAVTESEYDFTGEWLVIIPSTEGILKETVLIKENGKAEAIRAVLESPTVNGEVELGGHEASYEVSQDGAEVVLEADNGTTTFIGEFVDQIHVEGTWKHNFRGTTGTWTAEKVGS